MNRLYIIAGVLFIAIKLQAQSSVDDVLRQIETNNKTLQAEKQRFEAAKVEYRTGLTLYDPQVNYDYMKGSPVTAGNQTDFTVSQPFDFPTAYGKKKKVANLKSEQTDFEAALTRRKILFEAKLTCIRIIYGNKLKKELSNRLELAQKFYSDYQKKFEQKAASILDLNKAKLQLTSIQTELKLTETELTTNNQKLTELNAGNNLVLQDESYPVMTIPSGFESMFEQIEATDPIFKYYQKQKEVGDAQISLSKSLWLPKMEAGYHYQGILGQRFNGVHVGLNIPLWEKKNTVQFQQQQSLHYDYVLQNHHNEHYYLTKKLYEKASSLKSNYEEYQKNLETLNATELLTKALQAGELSTLEYFLETTIFYESRNKLLAIELAYYETLSELHKYEL
jgi:outer membrane protein, heavy metal efflux system